MQVSRPQQLQQVQAFFDQADAEGVTNAQKVARNQQVLRRVAETDKSRSVDAVSGEGSGVENGIVVQDGKLVGLGIHIFNEDVYPLQSFEIYLRSCGLVGSLDLTGCSDLVFLDLYHNQIQAIAVQGLSSMRIFGVQDNQLRSLDAREMPACQGIDAGKNLLTGIDVSGNPELVELYVNDNDLDRLDVGNNTKLKYLYCHNNRIRELDTTGNPLLRHLNATGNPLKRVRCLAPQREERCELELIAEEGGSVGLEFGPVYNAQWKETGEWKQLYVAYPDPGYEFEAWVEGDRDVSAEAELADEYGASRRLAARFRPGA